MGIRIVSTGVYVPERIIKNPEDQAMSDFTDDKNLNMFVGAGERRVCSEHETPSYMGMQAAKKALEKSNIDPATIDAVICYTAVADQETPRDVYKIVAETGCDGAMCWSIDTACASFISHLHCANALSRVDYRRMLLIDSMSWATRAFDEHTPFLPGDGAAAVIVDKQVGEGHLLDCLEKSSTNELDFITMQSAQVSGKREKIEFTSSPRVIHRAISILPEIANELLDKNGIDKDEVTWVITHQPGVPAIMKWHELLGIPVEKNLNTFSLYGNMSAANIPVTLDHFLDKEKKIRSGDLVLMFTAGAGIHAAAALYRF